MRTVLAAITFLAVATVCEPAGDPQLVRVWPKWQDADSFQSFYEYRTGRELVGRWIILRSQQGERAGLYFQTRVKNPGDAVRGATFVVRVISPNATDTRVFSFPTEVLAGSQLFEIGLTGKDWAGARVFPIAWDIELHAADGRLLDRKSSFLWEAPSR
jgi:hypothetical protein